MNLKFKNLRLNRSDLSDSAMTKASPKSSIWPRQPLRFGNDEAKAGETLIQSQQPLWFGHDEAQVQSLQLSYDDFSDLAMMNVSQRGLDSAAVTSLIWP